MILGEIKLHMTPQSCPFWLVESDWPLGGWIRWNLGLGWGLSEALSNFVCAENTKTSSDKTLSWSDKKQLPVPSSIIKMAQKERGGRMEMDVEKGKCTCAYSDIFSIVLMGLTPRQCVCIRRQLCLEWDLLPVFLSENVKNTCLGDCPHMPALGHNPMLTLHPDTANRTGILLSMARIRHLLFSEG